MKKAILLLVFLSFAFSAKAAEFSFSTKSQNIGMGQEFKVDLLLNTENQDINAIQGEIIFDASYLEVKEFNNVSSFINFWVSGPRIEESRIVFSGITPGGYSSKEGIVLSVIFKSKKEGQTSILTEKAKVLLNDGKATETSVKSLPLEINISKEESEEKELLFFGKDTMPPESFFPQIASSPDVFSGKWFLVFATQDKESGIDHYEVKEAKNAFISFSKWKIAESPYLLSDQGLRSNIFVKAIDKAGNERIEKIKAQFKWYLNYQLWGIIIIATMIVGIWLLKKKK